MKTAHQQTKPEALLGKNGSRLPDFLIIGAAKTGTTSLFMECLKSKDIQVPSMEETQFFVAYSAPEMLGEKNGHSTRHIAALEDYTNEFKKAGNGLCGEKSVSYLAFPDITIANIRELYAAPRKVKIIVVVRDPVQRAYSNYLMHRRGDIEPLSFYDATSVATIEQRKQMGYSFFWDYVGLSLYADNIEKYLQHFDNVLVFKQEFLKSNWKEALHVFKHFIGAESSHDSAKEESGQLLYNTTGIPRNRFGKWLVHIAYKENFIRDTLKYFLPKSVKSRMKHTVGAHFLSKPPICEKASNYLESYFADDQEKLNLLMGQSGYSIYCRGKKVSSDECSALPDWSLS